MPTAAPDTIGICLGRHAGHRSMARTRQWLHLAGVIFPKKAAALEQHLLGG
jgi:hypothetical protein